MNKKNKLCKVKIWSPCRVPLAIIAAPQPLALPQIVELDKSTRVCTKEPLLLVFQNTEQIYLHSSFLIIYTL